MFGEKNPKKMYNVYQCILVSKLYRDFFLLFFLSTSFNGTSLIFLVKIILIRNCKSMKGD